MPHLLRRELMSLAMGASLLAKARRLSFHPLISVQDFEQYPELITPAADFFVRNHFEIPEVDASKYRLRIRGLVEHQGTLSASELAGLPSTSLTTVLECAGNGVGVGAVGCARWEGPLLRTVLAGAGRKPAARFVRFTGADKGSEPDADDIPYARGVPLASALSDRTIVALHMNGQPLPVEHGAPARVVTAGRYGMDSVKWLSAIELLAEPDDSFYMTRRFRRVDRTGPGRLLDVIQVKSLIVTPRQNQPVRGTSVMAGGYAWAGAERIKRVDVRLDNGSWEQAVLGSERSPLCWVAWQYRSSELSPGVHSVEARAVSESGQMQPERRDGERSDGYELNQVQRISFFLAQ